MPTALSQLVVEETKHLISTGVSQTEAADKLGISVQSAHRIAKRNKKQIEDLALDLINDSIPLIKANHLSQLSLSNELSSLINSTSNKKQWQRFKQLGTKLDMIGLSAKDILTLADKKEYRALQVMGIAPSHTPSIIINQLVHTDNRTVLTPAMSQLFDRQTNDQDVEEAEFEVID